MRLTIHSTAHDFLQHTQAALEEDEVTNNLMLGVAMRLQRSPELIKTPPYLATVSDGTGLVLAALMTPPYPLTLYARRVGAGEAYELVARDCIARDQPVQRVSGRVPLARDFAAVWSRLTGAMGKRSMQMRIYALRHVVPAPSTPGYFRPATPADLPLVVQWARAFVKEAVPHDDPSAAEESARRRVHDGDIFLWEDGGRPVSMAARSRPMNKGIIVSLVYTPLDLRGRGYATACVAALSQQLLDEGWQFCALFTDLSNSTSNSIYQKIGYRPVCDFDEYRFE
jgi:predicted GNAT family acetyltransferase